ncbi:MULTISPECIES: VOC family protein [Thermomonosporaceae]|uniref:VOC family protein n=1 Tax=Thermomonosporaceae TaxID=2012 RepID=UPI00255AF9CE|nr:MULTISPECIES: VOC family protein [Thermomonosporaceae]MDL4776920.1 VOC family protein [Actinomadura xylanilytica]
MSANAEFIAVNIDCPEPPVLAAFYRDITGGEVTYEQEDYAATVLPGGVTLYFQKVADHRPPQWPDADHPQQFHLDFYVDDLDKAEASALEDGATKPAFQPGPDAWRVLADPAGHPFCLCLRKTS